MGMEERAWLCWPQVAWHCSDLLLAVVVKDVRCVT